MTMLDPSSYFGFVHVQVITMLMGTVLGNNPTSADGNMSPGCWAMYCFVQSAGHFFDWLPCSWEEGEAYQSSEQGFDRHE